MGLLMFDAGLLGGQGNPPVPLHQFSVEEYHRLLGSGLLREDQRVELLNGWIIDKMPHNPPHDALIDLVVGELLALLPKSWFPRVQSAIAATPDSQPEPDVAVVQGPRSRYLGHHPEPGEIGLVVEVSDSTLAQDRSLKGPIYAKAGIPWYWIVNLPGRCVEVLSNPDAKHERYATCETFGAGQRVGVHLEERKVGEIAVDAIFVGG